MLSHDDIIPLQTNLALKRKFVDMNLELKDVMEFTPLKLDIENRKMEDLLEFIADYRRFGSDREVMEQVQGARLFFPISPILSPTSNWRRFEMWLEGKPIWMKLRDMLAPEPVFRPDAELDDIEVEAEFKRLVAALLKVTIEVYMVAPDIPARLVYRYLLGQFDELMEIDQTDHPLGFCDLKCGECWQRPWCDAGNSCPMDEDLEAGKMVLSPDVAPYVCASPQAFANLHRAEAEQEAIWNSDPERKLHRETMLERWKLEDQQKYN